MSFAHPSPSLTTRRYRLRSIAAVLLTVLCLSPPAVGDGLEIKSRGGKIQAKWSDGGRALEVESRGEVVLTDDETAVESVSPGGYLDIVERRGLTRRSVKVVRGDDGRPEYRYYVFGLPREFDADARRWLAGVLPEVIDRTGLWAEPRARKLLARQGVSGVLAKVAEIESDYTQSIYYRVVLTEASLGASELEGVVRHLARQVESDYYKAELLGQALEHHPAGGTGFFAAIDSMGSDYYRHQVLTRLAGGAAGDDGTLASVARSGAAISSDHYRADLLVKLARSGRLGPDALAAWLRAADGLGSDYYRHQVLVALVEGQAMGGQGLVEVLGLAAAMSSDHYLSELLVPMARSLPSDPAVRTAFFGAVGRLGSDHYRHRTLSALLAGGRGGGETAALVLDSARGISSDHYKALILAEIGPALRGDEAGQLAYLEVAATLGSDHYKARALTSLLEGGDPGEPVLRRMLEMAQAEIRSDHTRGQVVERIAARL